MGYIHLIRHGTTEANKDRKYYGSTDIPLANDGVDIITNLAAAGIYPKADGAMLYTTGLLRAEQTFSLIYGDMEHKQIPEFREYDFGDFEMKTHQELMEYPAYHKWMADKNGLVPCPNGESAMDFKKRVGNGLASILECYKCPETKDLQSIIVCHGGVIAVIMGIFFPDHEKNIFQWQPDPGRGYSVLIQDDAAVSYEDI